jgi:AraC-like DNA-binding protein
MGLTCADLPGGVRAASFVSHLSRAFAVSFGDPPHRYVQQRRLENAPGLMLTDTVSLSRIAADCGFSGQAHFNRLFRKYVGETPGACPRTAPGSQAVPVAAPSQNVTSRR